MKEHEAAHDHLHTHVALHATHRWRFLAALLESHLAPLAPRIFRVVGHLAAVSAHAVLLDHDPLFALLRDLASPALSARVDLALCVDRKSVVYGKSVYVSVDLGGRMIIK